MKAIQRIMQIAGLLLGLSLRLPGSLGDDELGYVLAPLQTEFHRSEISSSASAILIWNANSAAAIRGDDLLETCRTQLDADLNELSQKTGTVLLIRIQYSLGTQLEKDVIVRLKDQLKELANKCGYLELKFSEEWTSSDWMSSIGALGTGLLDDSEEENLYVSKELVAVPVRTRISKLHAGMADVRIKLRQPFDAYNLNLSEQTKNAIRKAVQSMELSSRSKLHFQLDSTSAGAGVVDELFSNRQPPAIPEDAPKVIKELLLKQRENFKKSPALELAQELGFQDISYSHSSNGGAPELLLQKQAPDFELKSLDGNLVKWEEWRKGRPALITFWGVACGPCRLEAPHLSRLHHKYGGQIAIIGINAYPETDEEVSAYVAKEKLGHQIVVGGNSVARSSYGVAAYPTTFWVNQLGEVVRYVVGFESGEQLEAELVDFLAGEKP